MMPSHEKSFKYSPSSHHSCQRPSTSNPSLKSAGPVVALSSWRSLCNLTPCSSFSVPTRLRPKEVSRDSFLGTLTTVLLNYSPCSTIRLRWPGPTTCLCCTRLWRINSTLRWGKSLSSCSQDFHQSNSCSPPSSTRTSLLKLSAWMRS